MRIHHFTSPAPTAYSHCNLDTELVEMKGVFLPAVLLTTHTLTE